MGAEATELKALTDTIGQAHEEFKHTHEQHSAELKALGEARADTTEKLEKITQAMDDAEVKRQEIERDIKAFEATMKEHQGSRTDSNGVERTAEEIQYKSAWIDWMRTGEGVREGKALFQTICEQKGLDAKAMTIGTASAGGYALPEEIGSEILRRAYLRSPVMSLVRSRRVSTSDYKELLSGGIAGGWVAEGGSRAETNTATYYEAAPTHGEAYALPKVSNWSLDDLFFDVEAHITEEADITLAQLEQDAVINGNGTNRPTGFLDGTPVTTDDFGARAYGTLEYLASGQAATISADAVLDVVYGLHSMFTGNAVWLMNRSTMGAVRKLKDADNNYLFSNGLNGPGSASLAGHPVVIADHMPNIAANAFPMALGDWNQGYLHVSIGGMNMIRDNVTEKGHTLFYIYQRSGGIVRNDEAIKLMKCEV